MRKLSEISKKIVTYNEIGEFLKIYNYLDLVDIVTEKLNSGEIEIVKSSKQNGKIPSLYNKYRIIKNVNEDLLKELNDEIIYDLYVGFNKSYYQKYIEKYKEDREYIKKASYFFQYKKDKLQWEASINERSFQIFGEEKFLKDGRGLTILKNLGISEEDLNIYYTPEPFVYYSNNKNPNQVVLIIENKDTWYTIRRLMLKGNNIFLGERIDTIIYGAGKGIERSLQEYGDVVEEYLYKPEKILYWGDIDFEGFGIFNRLINRYTESFKIQIFKEAYIKMIIEAKKIKLPKTKDKQVRNPEALKEIELPGYEKEIEEILSKGYYIPQEIIGYELLMGE